MIANLYVDHLMTTPPVSSQEIWNATQAHGKLFTDAAARIGLTPDEYREFRAALLDGRAMYVRLPKRFDAMSGNRRGSVYAVHNAVLTQSVRGWRINLADGNIVYVPQLCGNISLLRRHADVAAAPRAVAPAYHAPKSKFKRAVALVPKENAVIAAPPAPDVSVPLGAPAAPVAATVIPAVAGPAGGGFFFLIPALLGGIIAGSGGGGGSSAGPAPCVPPIKSLSLNF